MPHRRESLLHRLVSHRALVELALDHRPPRLDRRSGAEPWSPDLQSAVIRPMLSAMEGLHEMVDTGFGIDVEHAGVLLVEQRVFAPGVTCPLPALRHEHLRG